MLLGLRLGLYLGLDLVSGWLVVMHTYLYYFPLSLSLSHVNHAKYNFETPFDNKMLARLLTVKSIVCARRQHLSCFWRRAVLPCQERTAVLCHVQCTCHLYVYIVAWGHLLYSLLMLRPLTLQCPSSGFRHYQTLKSLVLLSYSWFFAIVFSFFFSNL